MAPAVLYSHAPMATFLADLRFACHQLRKSPGFALVAILTLALGIGCNTGVFSFIYAWILTPAPFLQSNELTLVRFVNLTENWTEDMAPADSIDFREATRKVFKEVAAFDLTSFNLSGAAMAAQRVEGARISANFHGVFRVQPSFGRAFLPEEEEPGRDHVAILSDGIWRQRYGSDPQILQKNIRLEGVDDSA